MLVVVIEKVGANWSVSSVIPPRVEWRGTPLCFDPEQQLLIAKLPYLTDEFVFSKMASFLYQEQAATASCGNRI